MKVGAPALLRQSQDTLERFPADAARLWDAQRTRQTELAASGEYDLSWLGDRDIVLAGATGAGLGGALATALMEVARPRSLTVLSRDVSRSVEFETGKLMVMQQPRWAPAQNVAFARFEMAVRFRLFGQSGLLWETPTTSSSSLSMHADRWPNQALTC